jgi:hypothetical protein
LDVSFPNSANDTNPVPVDGSAAANQVSLGVVNQPIAAWNPGAALWLTWQMTDPLARGQGLAIDDLTFSASQGQTVVAAELTIQLAGPNVIISWPAALTGYQLQTTSDVSNPGSWTTVAQSVVVSNGFNTVSIPIVSTQFFRLKQ